MQLHQITSVFLTRGARSAAPYGAARFDGQSGGSGWAFWPSNWLLKADPPSPPLNWIQPHESTAAHTHDWPLHLHNNRFSAKSFVVLPDASATNHFGLFDRWGEVCCTW